MADTMYMTGNPVPSADPYDRHDNSIALDKAVNLKEDSYVSRLGETKRTLYWMEKAASGIPAVSAADRAEVAAAAAQLSAGIYDTTAAGLAATTNGKYFSVPQPGNPSTALMLYKNNAGAALYITSYATGVASSLTINYGKTFPNRRAVRNGVDSADNTALNEFVLDACVIGAEPGYYYRIGYYVNGNPTYPISPDGWAIERIASANYETAANTAEDVVSYLDPAPTIVNGLQTITLTSIKYPDLKFVLTVDGSKRPARGTAITTRLPAYAGYSHIIDPSVYLETTRRNGLTLNSGSVVPFRSVTRDGVVSPTNATLLNAILGAVVLNAKPGMYYGLKYFQNRNADVIPAADNWMIEEAPIATYGTSAAIETVNLISTIQEVSQPLIDRTLGIQTITLTTKTDVRILLTIDPAQLPPAGTIVAMSSKGVAGWSQVIDPAFYQFKSDKGGEVSYYIDMNGRLTVNWIDAAGEMRGYTFGVNGANDLPNFYNHIKGNKIVNQFGTDMLPPMVIDAASNVDPGAPLDFTGGNHTINSKKTALNIGFDIIADGRSIKTLGTSGRADNLVVRISNRLMACNTVEQARYVGQQDFVVTFFPGGAGVEAQFTAYEPVQLYIDYGPQLVNLNVEEKIFYFNGQYAAPVAYDPGATSGKPSEFPDAWAVLCTGADGQLGAWIDRNYGIADPKNSVDDYGLMIGSGAGSTSRKQYPTAYHRRLARDTVTPNFLPLATGASYKWRGGYVWQPVMTRTGVVAGFDYLLGGRVRRAEAASNIRVYDPDRDMVAPAIKALEKRVDGVGKRAGLPNIIPNGAFDNGGAGNVVYGDLDLLTRYQTPMTSFNIAELKALGCDGGFASLVSEDKFTGGFIEVDVRSMGDTGSLRAFASVLVHSPDGSFNMGSVGIDGPVAYRVTSDGVVTGTRLTNYDVLSSTLRRYYLAWQLTAPAAGITVDKLRLGYASNPPRTKDCYYSGFWLSIARESDLGRDSLTLADTQWPLWATGASSPVGAYQTRDQVRAIQAKLDKIALPPQALSELCKALRDPMHSVQLATIGDSITAGVGATKPPLDPEHPELQDPKRNIAINSYVNVMTRSFGATYSLGEAVNDTTTSFLYEKEHKMDPTAGDYRFRFINNASMRDVTSQVTVGTSSAAMFGRYVDFGNFLYSEFDLVGSGFTVVHAMFTNGSAATDKVEVWDLITNTKLGEFTWIGSEVKFGAESVVDLPYGRYRIQLRSVKAAASSGFRLEGFKVKQRIRVRNLGASGSGSMSWLPGSTFLNLVTGDDEFITIQLGTNDRGNTSQQPLNSSKTKANIKTIVNHLHGLGKKVVVMCASAARDTAEFPDPKYYYHMVDVCRANREAAKELGVDFIDNFTPTMKALQEGQAILPDTLHPNDEGMKIIAYNVLDRIYGQEP